MNATEKKPDQSATIYGNNVELYDIAFDWDITDEVDWLLLRLGNDCKLVLEPGCGSGRMLEAIARRGISIIGFDISPQAVAFANKRLMALGNASAVVGDMTSFNLGKLFDGAVCPVNTLAHLTPEHMALHLQCMGHHLPKGARYLAQVALRSSEASNPIESKIEWEAGRGETRLRISVKILEFDPIKSRELQGFHIEVLAGPRKGETIEEAHWMTAWTSDSWQKMIAESPFAQSSQYDGDSSERPQVAIGQCGNLMWHELVHR